MKKIIVITIFCISLTSYSQDQSQIRLERLLNNEYLDKTELKDELIEYDFSKLWTNEINQDYILGFIGSNYRRIQIRYISIIKNIENPNEYFVFGKTRVGKNVCDYQGKIEIIHIRKYLESDIDTIEQGVIIGKYKFYEDSKQNHVGTFQGIMTTSFYLDNDKKIHLDDLNFGADGYSNNEFVGTWNEYNSNEFKICNWGEYRIPFSEDLDVGAGEFMPNDKYLKYGWQKYNDDINNYYVNHKKIEKEIWWK